MYPLTKAALAGLFSFVVTNHVVRNDIQVVSELRGSVGNEELVLLARHKHLPINDQLLGGARLKYFAPDEREGYEGISSAYGYVDSSALQSAFGINAAPLAKFYVDPKDGKVTMQFADSSGKTLFKAADLPSGIIFH